MSTIIDIDDLVKQQEKFQFKLRGKTYSVPDRSYATAIEIAELGKKIDESIKGGDMTGVLVQNVEMLCAIVEEFTPDFVKKNLTIDEVRLVFNVINEHQLEAMESDNPMEKELNYYRKKHKDAYRKNVLKGEKKDESSPE